MIAPYHQALAAAGRMVVISNGGDPDAGIGASMTLIDPETLDVLATLSAPGSLTFPAARWVSCTCPMRVAAMPS